jgi:methylmalonyl-CoA mutase N-terminal domain/subunit
LERKEKFIVGVNEFIDKEEKIDIPILQISSEVETKQKERLASLKARRDNAKVEECLKEIGVAATSGKNFMPVFVKAAENYVTLGEMVGELKKHFGTYEEVAAF